MKGKSLFFLVLPLLAPLITSATSGEELYAKHCKKCHGDTGSGDTPMGKKLSIKDYTTAEAQEAVTDEAAREAIINGKKTESGRLAMMAFGKKLSDEEITVLIDYFRSLQAD